VTLLFAKYAREAAKALPSDKAYLTADPFGHRTIFFRDPDGNVLEIFAEI
jgi:catechol 2,3-dioxygenase-like lactoylglutathione lyase family enzyme